MKDIIPMCLLIPLKVHIDYNHNYIDLLFILQIYQINIICIGGVLSLNIIRLELFIFIISNLLTIEISSNEIKGSIVINQLLT